MNELNVREPRPLSQFLRMAVVAGVESAVQIHIDRGDDLNARDSSGMTPLMLSAARNKAAICRLLLGAGADHGLLDPSGKTALEIAITAGSDDTAAILRAVRAPPPSFLDSEITLQSSPVGASEAQADARPSASTDSLALEDRAVPRAPGSLPHSTPAIEMNGDGEFDLSGWEAEEEATPPAADLVVLDAASAIQIAITSHEPIDSSSGWDDIDVHLPEAALPLAREDDAEGRALLRRLLLRAIREGSVPSLDVQALSTNEDRSASPEAEAYLSMVVNDLGADLDERFEYADASESFEVFVDPEETSDEETALDEALSAIDRAAAPRHEPLQIYQREFQRLSLLTAEEEVRLAQDMEAALEAALDALATWPEGIARTLTAGAAAIAGLRPLSSVWVGVAEPSPDPASSDDFEAPTADVNAAEDELSEDASGEEGDPVAEAPADGGTTGFADALRQLGALAERREASQPSTHEIRQTLAALHLNRRFLLELIDVAGGPAPCPGFVRALADFRKARDRMTAANLKLAFFHAKKYLYSGEPLDDLAQEGNIGLLKAVDRYDWRRGFRFSTYATWWIRQQISRYVADKARTIRVPVHIYEKVQRMQRMAEAFEAAIGREPTLAELAGRMEMPSHKVAVLLRIARAPSCIDELPVDEMIAIDARDAYTSPDPADVVDEIQLRVAVDNLISSLSTKNRKEERVLRLRFGIGVDEALTLDEIGARFEVTRERIRQIEAKAIKKLQHPARSESFARLALGIQPEPSAFDPAAEEPDGADAPDTAEAAPKASGAKRQAAYRLPRDSIQPADSAKPSALEIILAQAAELGIDVEDERAESSGRIWVSLLNTPEKTHRRLARRLLEHGFEFWPGKGYWK